MRVIDIDFDNILFNEKSYKTYENNLIYDISCNTFMGAKPLNIWSEIDVLIKNYEELYI